MRPRSCSCAGSGYVRTRPPTRDARPRHGRPRTAGTGPGRRTARGRQSRRSRCGTSLSPPCVAMAEHGGNEARRLVARLPPAVSGTALTTYVEAKRRIAPSPAAEPPRTRSGRRRRRPPEVRRPSCRDAAVRARGGEVAAGCRFANRALRRNPPSARPRPRDRRDRARSRRGRVGAAVCSIGSWWERSQIPRPRCGVRGATTRSSSMTSSSTLPIRCTPSMPPETFAPEGVVVCSIPNVRHVSTSVPLVLRGEWRYEDLGVLDSTHLRSSPRRGFRDSSPTTAGESTRFEPINVCVEITDPEPRWWIRPLSRVSFGRSDPFFVLQYAVVAGPWLPPRPDGSVLLAAHRVEPEDLSRPPASTDLADAAGLDLVHEPADAVPVPEQRRRPEPGHRCLHAGLEVGERTEADVGVGGTPAAASILRARAFSSSPCMPHCVCCTTITSASRARVARSRSERTTSSVTSPPCCAARARRRGRDRGPGPDRCGRPCT